MIRLFEKNETSFNHNKQILSECISCIVTEDLEGIFDLDLVYPLLDSKGLSKNLLRGNIVKSPVCDDREDQLFRIRKPKIDTKSKQVTIYAQAIARADLMQDMVLGVRVPAGKTRKEAGQLVLGASLDNSSKYHIGNLDTNTNTSINLGLNDTTGELINYLDVDYVSPLQGFLGDSQSIQYAYGGEIRFDNFTIDMVDERGSDNTFKIKSGKNLQELQQEIDDTSEDFATALIMKSSDNIYLPNNEIIYSPKVDILGKKYKVITCDDISLVDNTPEALNVVYEQLRERGNKKFSEDGIDELSISNTVNFAELKKTEEYKNYSILEKAELGNKVTIEYIKIGLTVTARITKIKYDPLALNGKGKIIEVEIGNKKKKSIVNTINNTTDTTNNNSNKINTTNATVKENKKEAKEYTDNTASDLTVKMEKSDSDILLEVRNNKTDTDAVIQVMDGEIQERVTKGEFGSYITQNVSSIVEAIEDATGSHKMILDGAGVTIENGGLAIKNSDGNTVFWISSDGYVKLKDLQFDNQALEGNSFFINALANIAKISLNELSVSSKFTISQDNFRIEINGDSGYTLNEAIDKRLSHYDLI